LIYNYLQQKTGTKIPAAKIQEIFIEMPYLKGF